MYHGHALDEITLDGLFKEARDAAGMAAATGSRGTTERVFLNGELVSTITVERISTGPAWRVPADNIVIVLAGLPGRYTSHALSDLEQAIADEVHALLGISEPPENDDEDWQRSLLFGLDI